MKITKEELLKSIDYTLLKPDATREQLDLLLEEAVMYGFWAVCVRPIDVEYTAKVLQGTSVNVCSVVGFPWGIQTPETKAKEAKELVSKGATEIDMVLNRNFLKNPKRKKRSKHKSKAEFWEKIIEDLKNPRRINFSYEDDSYYDYSDLIRDISEVVEAAKKTNFSSPLVKVILETSELTEDEIIKACRISKYAGADFVKTSSGLYGGATIKQVKLMYKTVGNDLKIKASGGIKTWRQAKAMLNAGASRIGTSSGVKIYKNYLRAHS